MSKLLAMEYCKFKEEMDSKFELNQSLTSVDVFDTFVSALHKLTNVLSEEDLKPLVFNQFKAYGDFDKKMQAAAQHVSDARKSTEAAITAIDDNDTHALKSAYSQLKEYQKRINELEEDIYTDDVTGVYNRKYLFSHELDRDEAFKYDGILMQVCVNNFAEINKEHGLESGDTTLKFVSKILQKNLKTVGVQLVCYMGVQFIAVAKESVSTKVQAVFKDTVELVLSKKFKTHSGEILTIELQLDKKIFHKGQKFHEVYVGL